MAAAGPPAAFRDAVARAREREDEPQLRLLALEARHERWRSAGQALVQRAQAELERRSPAHEPLSRVIVSTGHRIDAAGRPTPRFPADREPVARRALAEALRAELAVAQGPVHGYSGLASGNDILFHELCAELGVRTSALLALPVDEYRARSVSDGGGDWDERYRSLCARLSPAVMADPVPSWVSGADRHYPFRRCNLWILEHAFAHADADVTLIALWNGAGGDGPGGTADMVERASRRGARLVHLDTRELFRRPPPIDRRRRASEREVTRKRADDERIAHGKGEGSESIASASEAAEPEQTEGT